MTKELLIRQYRQEDALEIITDPDERAWALLNEVSGPSVSYLLDGKVVACAGIRTIGLGEIWAVFADDAKELKFTLGKEAKKQLHEMMEAKDLWLVIATVNETTSQKQRKFLEFLGFEKVECYAIRKE